jgi:hypothetical protein
MSEYMIVDLCITNGDIKSCDFRRIVNYVSGGASPEKITQVICRPRS